MSKVPNVARCCISTYKDMQQYHNYKPGRQLAALLNYRILDLITYYT